MLETQELGLAIDQKMLVREISLQFVPGILYGILGPNGSGKSTFLKTLTGIWKPTFGRVLWKGDDLHVQPRDQISRTITLVPQNPQVHFDYTVLDMVTMGRYPYNFQKNENPKELVIWALKTVDAWHLKGRSVVKLSHGEKKRVYIARALITGSPILLLDEPTEGLDIRHQLEIWKLLKGLALQGKIIIVTNHDLNATERFCDHVAILNQGRCICCGTCREVLKRDLLKEVFGVEEQSQGRHNFFELA